jgi:rod shape-determining protein MreC
MPEILRRHSLVITVIALLITCGQLMSASISNSALPRMGAVVLSSFISPMQELHHEMIYSGKRFWEHYVWLQNVETERNELESRLKELEAQNSRLIESEHENKRLKELLRFREETQIPGLAASVIGRDSSNWAKTVTLDRGAADGLRVGLPVVDGNAIVGQVISVDHSSAKVLLIADNSSAIDAIVQNSRAQGIVEGMATRKLQLRYVLKDYAVATGERVIASGLDGVFPKGTLIGVVTKVEPTTNGLFQNIELQPSVDLNRLETVLVLLDVQPMQHQAAAAEKAEETK